MEAFHEHDRNAGRRGRAADGPDLTVDAVTYAYRRLGTRDDRWPPLLFLQHFRGNLDNWDPLFVDTIAAHREVILLDNAGVGLSSGRVPRTVTEMARDAIAFLDELDVDRVDVLGYSLGGMVAQELALLRPRAVRRLVLAGTGPRGGRHMHGWIFDIERTANNADNGIEDLLHIFFEVTETSRALGREYVQRAFSRTGDRDAPTGSEVARAVRRDRRVGHPRPDPAQPPGRHYAAHAGRQRRQRHDDPHHLLADRLPNARLRIYPDASHGFVFQYPRQCAELVTAFLSPPLYERRD